SLSSARGLPGQMRSIASGIYSVSIVIHRPNWPYQLFLKPPNGSHIHHFPSQSYCPAITFD
ncbi:TPA: hypothetical protein ACN02O_000997, partial [Klebsiella oxytoca]